MLMEEIEYCYIHVYPLTTLFGGYIYKSVYNSFYQLKIKPTIVITSLFSELRSPPVGTFCNLHLRSKSNHSWENEQIISR